MSRSVIMVTCPKCGHTFPAKEEKGTGKILAETVTKIGAPAGVGFLIGGPIGAGIGSLVGSFWSAFTTVTDCSCPKCGASVDRPTVQ